MPEPSIGSASDLSTPVLVAVNSLARTLLGMDLTIVYPTRTGWAESTPGMRGSRPEFCRLVQSTPEGAKHCRMCHILMSVAADSSGVCEQRCHAGSRVLVAPIHTEHGEAHSVLTSCIFAGSAAIPEVRARARKLGINVKSLIAAFRLLPTVPEEKMDLVKKILNVACEATHEVLLRLLLGQKLRELSHHRDRPSTAIQAFEQALGELCVSAEGAHNAATTGAGTPHTIRLVADLIAKRPYLPFSVNQLAASSRLTRNHFSTLFHKHVGKSFSTYLAERRMALAMKLLQDPRLNIGEVAGRAGYDDPGYFSRRFRRETGLCPREWREQCVVITPPPEHTETEMPGPLEYGHDPANAENAPFSTSGDNKEC